MFGVSLGKIERLRRWDECAWAFMRLSEKRRDFELFLSRTEPVIIIVVEINGYAAAILGLAFRKIPESFPTVGGVRDFEGRFGATIP